MKKPTNPEVFRFLDLPSEVRNRIYENLLVHHEPVALTTDFRQEDKEFVYTTRLGLAPRVCRTSKAIAYESLAVLYGKNTFHFTVENIISSVFFSVGLHVYSEFIKTIVVNTFQASFARELEEHVNGSRQSNWQDSRLRIQSNAWVAKDIIPKSLGTRILKNLKMIRLNLPLGLEILTDNNQKLLLDMKRDICAHTHVEFSGATPDIVSRLTAAWPLHVPQEIIIPPRK